MKWRANARTDAIVDNLNVTQYYGTPVEASSLCNASWEKKKWQGQA